MYAVSAKLWNWQEGNAVCLTAAVCIVLYHTKHVGVIWLFTAYAIRAINFIGLHQVKSIMTMGINYNYEDNLIIAMG